MNELESLDRIKEAEAKAAQTLERAHQTKARMIDDAKKEAAEMVGSALEKSRQFREERLKALKEKLESRKAARINENEKAVGNVKKLTSSDKFKKEVDSLVRKFFEMV